MLMRFVALCLLTFSSVTTQAQVSLQSKQFKISFDHTGKMTEMTDRLSGTNYLAAGEPSFLLSIRHNGKLVGSEKLQWKNKSSEIVLFYPDNITATIKTNQNQDYIKFELVHFTNPTDVDLVLWGPYPTTIGDTIGEVVGVVRNKNFAIGIQSLNIKTLGGYPTAESDIQPSYDVFAGGNKVDVVKDDLNKQLFRGDVARPMPYGSSLQAYCRNRNKDRIIENWSHPRYFSRAYTKDGGIVGTKLAIFGTTDALATISTIEQKEHLPHPMIDGVWGKRSAKATESYLIMGFGQSNLQEAIDLTHQAGLNYLYHEGPFDTWGHFKLNSKDFPDNWASLKSCVDKAKSQNVKLGVHTLSNFITTNDPYVTPVPDKRLARVGYSQLAENIDQRTNEIIIKDPAFFNQFENNTLKAAVIGNEIIRYKTISNTAPWKLLNCQRGAFNTTAAKHNENDSIGKLMDHAYQVFLGDHELDQEIAKTIARLFNETGLMQMSFDGLEGCWSEGMGDYGKQLFTQTWYENLKPELKGKVINDASNPGHYYWHIYSRMNWGEPWYAGFRESQLQLRLKNQQFYRRNLMPSMLGWFSLKPETSLEDIEWMLARGAGFDAGFGLSTSIQALNKNGRKDDILKAISSWENARQARLFTEQQKQKMQQTENEYHLEADKNGVFQLYPVHNAYFVHEQKAKQPGEPTSSAFEFNNPAQAQPIEFIVTMPAKENSDPDVSFDNLTLSVNQQDALKLPVQLRQRQILYCNGKSLKVFNSQWQLIQSLELKKPLPWLTEGNNEITLDGQYSGDGGADIKMEIRVKNSPEAIKK